MADYISLSGLSPLGSMGSSLFLNGSKSAATNFTSIFISELLKQYLKEQQSNQEENGSSAFWPDQSGMLNEILIKQLALDLAEKDIFGFKSFFPGESDNQL